LGYGGLIGQRRACCDLSRVHIADFEVFVGLHSFVPEIIGIARFQLHDTLLFSLFVTVRIRKRYGWDQGR
jgi:hypothetical protein